MPRPDVVVVGAGIAGASAAWHLARDGRRVLVLEQAPQPASEATAQNAGMLRRLGEDPFDRALACRTAERLADPEDGRLAAASRVTGAVLALAWEREHLADGVAHLRARGVRVEALDRPEEAAPALAGAPPARAWWLPDERVVDPHALVSALLAGARERGARLRCGVRVVGLLRRGDRVVGVRTEEGEVEAGAVVLAAGAWAAALAASAGLRRPLNPLRRHLLHGAPHPLSRPDHPWVWVDDAGVYARPEAGGWLVSGCDETPEPPPAGPGSAGPVEEEGRALAADKLERFLPALAGLRLSGGWTGLRTFAPDRRPLVGEDAEAPGLWWLAGLGGFGVSGGLAAGELLAAWMRGADVPWMRVRFPLLPHRPHLRRWPVRPRGRLDELRLVPADAGSAAPRSR